MTTRFSAARPRAGAKGHRFALGAAIAAMALALGAGPAAAAAPPAYDSIPTTLPGNVVSFAFEANSAREFGDYIALGGTERSRASLPVTIVMSIWACQHGGDATCVTTPGATWSQPLTLTIYNVTTTGAVPAAGSVVLTTTQDFDLPFRPSYDPTGPCAQQGKTGWWSAGESHCYNGLAHLVTFNLPPGSNLPDQLIWGISFDTQHYGASPKGVEGPYNSLNVGTQTFAGQPVYGQDVESNGVFIDSLSSGAYGDGGANGLGTFRDDTGTFPDGTTWGDYKPLACFGTTCPVQALISSAPASDSASPFESVGGIVGTPVRNTPPPTGTGDPSDGGSGGAVAFLICTALGAGALVAVVAQRRTARR